MRVKSILSLIQLVSLVVLPVLASAQDIPNSHDHPLITRYAVQTIRHFNAKEFDQYNWF